MSRKSTESILQGSIRVQNGYISNCIKFIDSQEFFSWERYFTKLLVQKTEMTYLKYQKAKLNPVYLHEKNKRTILDSIKGVEFNR